MDTLRHRNTSRARSIRSKRARLIAEGLEGRQLLATIPLQSATVRPDGRIIELRFTGNIGSANGVPDWMPAFSDGVRLTTSTGTALEPLGTVVTKAGTITTWTTSFLVSDSAQAITFDSRSLTISAPEGLIRDDTGNRTPIIAAVALSNNSLVDRDGFSTNSFERGTGGVTIYISTRHGSDSRSLTQAQDPRTPLKSPQKAQQLLTQAKLNRSGSAVRLLRGDTFEGKILLQAMGQDSRHPFVLEDYWYDYGDGRADPGTRPVISIDWAKGQRDGLEARASLIHDVVIRRIQFESVNRSAERGTVRAGRGLLITGGSRGWTIDDCVVSGFQTGLGLHSSDVTVLRSSILDSHSPRAHAQGLFASGADRLLVSQSTFDRNGRTSYDLRGRTIFSHTMYLQRGQGPAVVWGNVIHAGGSHGAQMRSGGIFAYNYVGGTPIAAYIAGAGGAITRNVVEAAEDIGGWGRGWGFQFGGPDTEMTMDRGTIEFNIIAHPRSAGMPRALDAGNPNVGAGLIRYNTVVNAGSLGYRNPSNERPGGLRIESNIFDAGTGAVISVNPGAGQFKDITGKTLAAFMGANLDWHVTTDRNVYSSSQGRGFEVKGQRMNLAEWRSLTGQDSHSLWATPTFANRDADIGDFSASEGGAGTEAGYIEEMRSREAGKWGTRFDTTRLLAFYVRAYRPLNLPTRADGTPAFGASALSRA